jgi:hypothetical protein
VLLLNKLGLPVANSLSGVIALLVSLIIAGCSLLGRMLRPTHWWWVSIGGLLLFNRLFFSAVPPTAIVSPLIVLLVLIAIYIREQPIVSNRWLIIFGALLGLGLATRLTISGVIGALLIIWLVPKLRWRLSWLIASALLVLVIFDFYFIVEPTQHLASIYQKVFTHYTHKFAPLSLRELLLTSPFAFISLLLASLALWLPPVKFSIKRRDLAALIILTLLVGWLLWQSSYKPRWYFYPLIFLWEILLPLWLIDLMPTFTFTGYLKPWRLYLIHIMQIGVVALFVMGQAVLFWHLYQLPVTIFVL